VLLRAAHWLSHCHHDPESPVWRPWPEAFSARRRFVRYDPRGCGLSDRNAADLSLEAWQDDLETVAASIDAPRIVLLPVLPRCDGQPVMETAMIKWTDVKGMDRPVEGNVTLTLCHTKGGKVRTITLRQQAIDILLKIPRSNRSPYIFWNRTEEGYYKSASNMFWEYGQETSSARGCTTSATSLRSSA
jgi:integrase